nr:ATP-binding protein [Spirosoma pollinicola]
MRFEDGLVVSYTNITQFRAIAEAARLSSLFQQAFDASVNGSTVYEAVYDEDGQIEDFRFRLINDAGLRMSGYTREQLLGQTLWQIYPATGINGMFGEYVRVCETGQPFSGEKYYPEYDIWRDMMVVAVPGGVLVTYSDTTAYHKAQEAAHQQAQLLHGILKGVPVGIAVVNARRTATDDHRIADFSIVRVNSLFETVFGPAAAGQALTAVMTNARESGLFSRCILSFQLNEPQEFEMSHFMADQSAGWYRVSVSADGDQLILAFTDITELKRAQLTHYHQAELLSSVLDSSPNDILAFDAVQDADNRVVDFRYILQNQAKRQRTGRSDEQVVGHTMLEIFPIVKVNGLFDEYVEVLKTGRPFRQDIPFDYGHGSGWYNVSAVKRNNGMVLTIQDKTAEKEAEEKLRINQRQLEQAFAGLKAANEHLQQFAYVASHDLQEPLRKIQSFGDLLLNQYTTELPDTAGDLLRRMQNAAVRMSALIRSILAFSRLTTHQQPFTSVSLSDVVAGVLDDQERVIQQRNARINLDALPTVMADAVQMQQLFSHLIGNALKYVHSGQSPVVTLTSRLIGGAAIPETVLLATAVGRQPAAEFWEITVADNGIGFDEKYLDRLFQMFQRLHGKTQYEGTGMGLAICKRVMDNHHGMITAHSQPDQGARFVVYLPR